MSKKLEFQIPKGYDIPEGTDEGDTFEASAMFRLEGGKMCLEAVDGVAMPGYEDKAEKGEKSGDLAQRYAAAMAAPEQQPMT